MKKIAVLIDDEFQDHEYKKPCDAFKEKGYEISHIGIEKEKIVIGMMGSKIKIDLSINDAEEKNFNALLIPGGHSPDKLRSNKKVLDLVKKFMDANKPIFAICRGPVILISANVVKGKNLTGWKDIKEEISNAGANFIDKEVVVEDNLITSRNPGDIPAFINAALLKLK